MDMKKALQEAIEFEEKGFDIYTETAKKTSNPIVRRTFRYLADQEKNHIQEIKGYMENRDIKLKGDSAEETKKFFNKSMQDFKKKTELSENDRQAHEVALDLERDSYNFYKRQKDENPDLDFFSFLMEQERAHYELIEKSYLFIRDPAAFYSGEEDWFFEG